MEFSVRNLNRKHFPQMPLIFTEHIVPSGVVHAKDAKLICSTFLTVKHFCHAEPDRREDGRSARFPEFKSEILPADAAVLLKGRISGKKNLIKFKFCLRLILLYQKLCIFYRLIFAEDFPMNLLDRYLVVKPNGILLFSGKRKTGYNFNINL